MSLLQNDWFIRLHEPRTASSMAAFSSPGRILELGTDCNFLFHLWGSSRVLSNLQGISLSQAPGHPQSQAHSSWLRLVDIHVSAAIFACANYMTAWAACSRFWHQTPQLPNWTKNTGTLQKITTGICVRKLRFLLSCSSPYTVVSKPSKCLHELVDQDESRKMFQWMYEKHLKIMLPLSSAEAKMAVDKC